MRLTEAMHKISSESFRRQFFRGALLGFLLAATILGWPVVGAA